MTFILVFLIAFLNATALIVMILEGSKYLRARRVYKNSRWLKEYRLSRIRKLGILIPKTVGGQFKSNQALLQESGSSLTVEELYLIKWALVFAAMMLFTGVYITNLRYDMGVVREDLNFGRLATEVLMPQSNEAKKQEVILTRIVEAKMKKINIHDPTIGKKAIIKSVQGLILEKGITLPEPPEDVAERLYRKLLWMQTKSTSIRPLLVVVVACIAAFYTPTALIWLSGALKSWKRPLEIISLYNVFSICSRIEPFDLRVILQNMLLVAESYKQPLEELYEDIKLNKGETAFDAIMKKSSCESFRELLETLKIAGGRAGVQNLLLEVDQTSEYKLKWMEIDSIMKREGRTKYAMIPVGLMLLLGMLYFSLGMTVVSNPYTFLGK